MSNNQHQATATALSSLKDIHSVYFIGIGGIGMSALARYFIAKGVMVSGYDKTETELTKKLVEEGIPVHYTEDVNNIPKDVDLVVYTPAVPKQHAELVYYQENNYKVVKRSDVLGAISADTFNICVAGTHGKTTVSTMVAHILRDSGYGCNAFLGGISTNYNTNFWSDPNNVSVIEADEYDRSFLKLSPDVAIITAMDADHLDIYGDEATMQQAFVEFGSKVKPGGLLISKFGLTKAKDIKADNKWTYSTTNDAASVYTLDIKIQEGGYDFNVQLPGGMISGFRLNMGGMHNVENAVAAIAVAYKLEIDEEKIKAAIASFRGVKRRFEYVLPWEPKEKGGYVYPILIDDYAHHPEELRALLRSTRNLFPQRKITVIFQPHLFSRTKDFANEFSSSLDIADRIILLPIYPARELPMEGVTSEIILKNIQGEDKQLLSKEELLDWARRYANEIDKEFGEVIVVAGAGDIDQLVAPLKQIFANA
ncbi:UDP-N-acetylmuramate--L-alanine ligase [Flavisolibacter tropicus]|uniref:UDP-N-acetylmuramate--L-alanine ligase n=1 Tax=Flavisolibacter tropicus TaxID=1492898 RepID=A0A172TUY7_9BACT|nr:UDP-N-acetylmuramate--L-alanine ligase [Flavisolibacter tropicus]ANE50547.1 UDP-N-acetylmuramate--alanine ligase [Flavisolibacter tropicus]